jgi:hypothetical protein
MTRIERSQLAVALTLEADHWWPYDDELTPEDDRTLRRIESQLLEQAGTGIEMWMSHQPNLAPTGLDRGERT